VRTTLSTALLFALGAVPALAGAPQERVRQTVDAVSAVVNDPQLQASSKEHDRRERVVRIMHESFDFSTMARESLGSDWAHLAPEQRERFVGLFAQLFERSYDRLVLRFLGGSSTTYGAESVDAERAVVKTALHRKGGDELPVDYRLTADGGVWKISDVVVDGVSLAGNFRAQFTKTIRASSYDALVQRIETKLAEEK
jgi:phospholipid transport system substrate-binding protein